MKTHQKQQGFTLIEMIITVAIAAILASIAVPSFTKMIERNRISTGTNEFLAAMILARSEAVKRSQNVTVCVANTAQNGCAASSEFSDGWLVFVECGDIGAAGNQGVVNTGNFCDTNDDGTLNAPEEILKVHGGLPQLSIKSGILTNITYNPSGRSDNITLVIGKDSATPTKQIEVSLTGRVRSSNHP